jgi:hypothetical protein
MKHYGIKIFFVIVILFGINLFVLPQYGITWDYHHVFFGGLYHLRLPMKPEMEQYLPFTEPDPRKMWISPFGPIMTTLPVLSYHFLYDEWRMLPFDTAYLLPTVIIGTLGIIAFYLFIKEGSKMVLTGFIAALFLLLYPRFFSELHINFKDTPQAVFFMINMWMIWRLVMKKRIQDLILASLSFAIAINDKVNALFILPIAGIFAFYISYSKEWNNHIIKNWYIRITTVLRNTLLSFFQPKKYLLITLYFLFSILFAFLLWAFFWDQPLHQFIYLLDFFKDNTMNMEVLYFGKWYCSAINVPWHYPLGYLSIVTPLPILLLFIIGIFYSIFRIIKGDKFPLLLLLWFILPLFRYMSPAIGVIDGIRHFEEVIFPLVAIAALPAAQIITYLFRKYHQMLQMKHMTLYSQRVVLFIAVFSIPLVVLFHLIWNVIKLHPYQIAYFNELVGGTKGAMGNFDLDYWGASQKAAVEWVNLHAAPNARVHIAMSGDTAGKYLRPDLLPNLNSVGYEYSDYVIVLNRPSFFYRYYWLYEYILHRTPVHTIEADGVPMTFIYDNKTVLKERQKEWWNAEDPCIWHYW